MEKNVVAGPPLERMIDATLGELVYMVLQTNLDNVIQVDAISGEELTAKLLLQRSVALAKWFRSKNIAIEDAISINSENRLEFPTISIAGWFVGATFAPLNPEYTPGELKHVLGLSKPKVLFCTKNTVDKIVNIQNDHPYVKHIVYIGKESTKYSHIERFEDIIRDVNEDYDYELEITKYDGETVATILCSSGTTGLPKGVMCTHNNMTTFLDVGRTALANIATNDDPSDAICGLVPFFHSFGFMLMILNVLRSKKMIVFSRFNAKVFLEAISKYQMKRLIVPPAVLMAVIKHPLSKNYDLSSIVEVRTGAAPMGKDTELELRKRFKINQVSQAYGMTETTLGVILQYGPKNKIGSVGLVVPGMFAKVIDEKGNALPAYQEGELCVKGPLIMKGYIGDPKATQSTIDKDNWLHTGDVAYYDDEGFFYIVDRIKELIKYKGFQVAPAELEALLVTHDAIRDAAVIGLPDEDAGELPLAYVAKKPGKNLTEKEVEKFVADHVSRQKQLRGGVIFIDEIPRNATGKILRRVLRERAIKKKSKL